MFRRVDISIIIMAMYDAGGIIEYGRGTPELSNKPLHTKQDTPE